MSANRLAQGFARAIRALMAHSLSRVRVSLEEGQVSVWRRKRLLAFNDHNHRFSLSTSLVFNSVTCACAAGIVWENRFQLVCRRHIDLFTSE